MSEAKIRQSLHNLEKALSRLKEALAEPIDNEIVIDGTIQRFEFCIELFWKTLKRLLLFEGIETKTPRETLKQAYQIGWLNDETAWLEMLKDRNLTSHIYDEVMAGEIFNHIHKNFAELERTFHFLKQRFAEIFNG